MAEGFERRDVVQDANAPTGRPGQVANIPLAPVQTPRPSSISGGSKELRQLAETLGSARTILDKYVDKKMNEWFVEGKMQFAEGVAESEIAADGNKFTAAGYQTMKLRAASNQWFQNSLDSIDSEDHQLTSEQYQEKLSSGFTGLMDLAGDDEGSRALLTDMASESMPKLVTQHTKAHNAFNKENSRESYKDLLVSERAEPEELQFLAHPTSSLFPLEEHNAIVAESMAIQLNSDNTSLYDALTPGAETVQDFMSHGYTEAEATGMTNARERNKAVNGQKFTEQRVATEAAILDDASSSGNLPKTFKDIQAAQKILGTDDAWANKVLSAASSAINAQKKEETRTARISDSVKDRDLDLLAGKDRERGFELARANAVTVAMNDPRVRSANPERQEAALKDVSREIYYTELHAQNNIVDPTIKRDMNAINAKSVFKDESVTPEALDAFEDYQMMINVGGRAMADKYLEPGYAQDLILIARQNALGTASDSESALTLAAGELDSTGPATPKHLQSPAFAVSDERLSGKLEDALDEVMFPGTLIGRTASRIIGSSRTALAPFAVTADERLRARQSPAMKVYAEIEARREMSKLPVGMKQGTKEKLAVQRAVAKVASKAEYINGEFVINPIEDAVQSVSAAAGVEGKTGAVDAGFRVIMKALGEERYGDDYNNFQFFDQPINDEGFAGFLNKVGAITSDVVRLSDTGQLGASIYDQLRGVPSMKIDYHQESGNLIIRPYGEKERHTTLDDPMVIPIKTVGDIYKATVNGNEEQVTTILNQLRENMGLTQVIEGTITSSKVFESTSKNEFRALVEPITVKEAAKNGDVLYGANAISFIENIEGELSPEEKRVVELEGYVKVPYFDVGGIPAIGVGQTGRFMKAGFKSSFAEHEDRTRNAVERYDDYPVYLRQELAQTTYRGDLKSSHKWVNSLNKGNYTKAAKQFLDHTEFKERKAKGDDGVVLRMEAMRDALLRYAKDADTGALTN